MTGKVLDQGRGSLDNVGVEPKDPRGLGSNGGEEKRVSCASHGGTAKLLGGQRVSVLLVLWGRSVEVLSHNGDAVETVLLGTVLNLLDGGFKLCQRGIALARLGHDEPKLNQLMGVAKLQQVVPVLGVEAGKRGKKQDAFPVSFGVCGRRNVVQLVMSDLSAADF